MDLKGYYRKIRELEETLDEFVVVKSLATESGGRAGVLNEAVRATAARMVTDGVAEIASEDEAAEYRSAAKQARSAEAERRQSSQIQFSVITDAELRSLTGGDRASKES